MKKYLCLLAVIIITLPNALFAQPNTGDWGLDRVNQRILPLDSNSVATNDGSEAHVYLFGTGIRGASGKRGKRHEQFHRQGWLGYRIKHYWPPFTPSKDREDCNGHSTASAGLVGARDYGVATGVTIHSVKVFNCSGTGSWSAFSAAAQKLEADLRDNDPLTAPEPAIVLIDFVPGPNANSILDGLIDAGALVIVPAGNDASDACTYQAHPSAITVGGTYITATLLIPDGTDYLAPYSNVGSCIDLLAPSGWDSGIFNGQMLYSNGPALTTTSAAHRRAVIERAGTENAAALVAGAAAVYWTQAPSSTAAQIEGQLMNHATPNVVGVRLNTPSRMVYVP